MTESLHHISANVVGFLPVVVLLMTKVMSGDDLRALDWPVLWLVAGGIALGSGVSATGLDKWMLGSIQWASIPGMLLIFVLALVGWVTSNVISHSASANLLIPMGMGLATTVSTSAAEIAIVIALGCSAGMLPADFDPAERDRVLDGHHADPRNGDRRHRRRHCRHHPPGVRRAAHVGIHWGDVTCP